MKYKIGDYVVLNELCEKSYWVVNIEQQMKIIGINESDSSYLLDKNYFKNALSGESHTQDNVVSEIFITQNNKSFRVKKLERILEE